MKIDPKFTEKIQEWLNKEPKEKKDALSGAQLLQQINPRNSMYRRFINLAIQRPEHILPKIIYELKIHLKYRLDGLTLEEVNKLDRKVIPEAKSIIDAGIPENDGTEQYTDEQGNIVSRLGRRADHEKLPDEIKEHWESNRNLYKKIKDLFEELKSMEDVPSCQRYDKLQFLASMDKKYLHRMKMYDDFVIGEDKGKSDKDKNDKECEVPAHGDTILSITSSRAYISKNKTKLAKLHETAHIAEATPQDIEAYNSFVEKMQRYVNNLIAANAVTDEMKESLSPLGIAFESNGNEDDTEHSEATE